jgi:hypothetical protein
MRERVRYDALTGLGEVLPARAEVEVMVRGKEQTLVRYNGQVIWVDTADLEPVPKTAWERLDEDDPFGV